MHKKLQPYCNQRYFIMASAKIFLFKHKKLKNGSHPVVLQIIKDGQRKLISLGHSAYVNQWDFEKEMPNKTHSNFKDLKILIRDKINQAEKKIIQLDDQDEPYSIEELVDALNIKKSSKSVFLYTEALIKRMEKSGSIGNARVYQNTLNVFKEYSNDRDLKFNSLTTRVVNDFIEYLSAKGNKKNSISVHFRTLRAIYNKAIQEKAAQEALYPFNKIKVKTESTLKRAITKEKINEIRKLKLSNKSELDKARDYFLFSFNMRGMSFVDIAELKVRAILDDRVVYSRKKTRQKFNIKITREAKSIIEKYSDLKDPISYIFPIIKRRKKEFLDYRNAMRLTNKKLKKIGEKAKIKIPLTMYVARHSWATIAKRSGIPTAVISEGMGHDSELTTQIYLDSFESSVLDKANEQITS